MKVPRDTHIILDMSGKARDILLNDWIEQIGCLYRPHYSDIEHSNNSCVIHREGLYERIACHVFYHSFSICIS